MNVKEEDVFLIVLAQALKNSRDKPATEIALACGDVTKEIMSVANKMSKSNILGEDTE